MNPLRALILRSAPWIAALACAAGVFTASAARADDTAQAPDAMILEVSNQVLDAIRSDKAIQAGDFGRIQKLVDERILPHVDFERMTRLCVGRPWRTATPEQRNSLTEQFRILLLRTYSGALARVSDQKAQLRPARGQDSPNDVIVRTQISASQGDPISIDYRLAKTEAGWKIYDLNILGIWLVENYKNEFGQTLSQSGVDGLIQQLTAKNQRLAASSAK